MKIIPIIVGNFNNLVGRYRKLKRFRTEPGCRRCAVAYDEKNNYTGWCQKDKGGCGCIAGSKSSMDNESTACELGVWANRYVIQNKLIAINEKHDFKPKDEIQKDVVLELDYNYNVQARIEKP